MSYTISDVGQSLTFGFVSSTARTAYQRPESIEAAIPHVGSTAQM